MRSSFSTILLLYHVLSIWNFLILTCTIYILAPLFVIFQSTLPQGERPNYQDDITEGVVFQSTLPQGERREIGDGAVLFVIFQSTLPQGERRAVTQFPHWIGRFQSTLPQGERLCRCLQWYKFHNFNPRSRKGSDGFQMANILSN